MSKLPESLDGFQPPYEQEWIEQHGEAALAPITALLRNIDDIRLTRAGDREAAERLAERAARRGHWFPGFKLFPDAKLAVYRIALADRRRSRAEVKHDALRVGVMVAVADDAARQLPIGVYLTQRLPTTIYRVAQADLLEQARLIKPPPTEIPLTEPVITPDEREDDEPDLTSSRSPPMEPVVETPLPRLDPDLVEAKIAHLPPSQQTLLRLLGIEGLSYEEAATVMGKRPAALAALVYRIRKGLLKEEVHNLQTQRFRARVIFSPPDPHRGIGEAMSAPVTEGRMADTEKFYVQVLVKRGRGRAIPVLATDDVMLIEGFTRLVAERFGIDVSEQAKMVPPPEKRAEPEEG